MEKSVSHVSRREFMTGSAALAAVGASLPMQADTHQFASRAATNEFDIYQQRRRWNSGANWAICPGTTSPRRRALVRTEKHEGYTLERLILDLNGIEPVPAVLLIPDRRRSGRLGCCLYIGTPASTTWAKNNCCGVQACNRRTRRFVQKKAW